MKKSTIIAIAVFLLLIAGLLYYNSGTTGSASIVGSGTCVKFVDVDGNQFKSFNNMRDKIADLNSASDTKFQSLGFLEESDGVYICR